MRVKKTLEMYAPTILCAFVFLYIIFFSEGILDPDDAVAHYTISNYSWKYPHLLLDYWGEPLFSLLSSPFAQFGFNGMLMFNLLLYIYTAIVLTKVGNVLKQEGKIIIPLLCAFMPVYFEVVIGGMTEVLFAAIYSTAIYLSLTNRHKLAATVLSFAIVSRPEAQIIIPIFFVYYLVLKKLRASVLLFTGLFVYGVIGVLYYGSIDDFWWLFTKSSYSNASYGVGGVLQFAHKYNEIYGIPILLLIFFGFVSMKKKIANKKWAEITNWGSLIIVPSVAVFFVYSYLWWKGIQGSLGVVRVISTTAPAIAILASEGVSYLITWSKTKAWNRYYVSQVVVAVIAFFVVIQPFKLKEYPIKLGEMNALITKAADWYNEENIVPPRIVYLSPYFAFLTNIDPYEEKRSTKIWDLGDPSETTLNTGDWLVWDGYYSPNEGHSPMSLYFENPNFELKKTFSPMPSNINVLGDNDFEYYFFEVNKERGESKLQDLKINEGSLSLQEEKEYLDLKSIPLQWENGFDEFLVQYNLKGNSIKGGELFFCVSLENMEGVKLHYEHHKLDVSSNKSGDYNIEGELIFPINDLLVEGEEATLKIYYWNHKNIETQIHDSKIEIKGTSFGDKGEKILISSYQLEPILISTTDTFFYTQEKKIEKGEDLTMIRMELEFDYEPIPSTITLPFVVKMDSNDTNLIYKEYKFELNKEGGHVHKTIYIPIPEKIQQSNKVQSYFWNNEKKSVHLKNLKCKYTGRFF